jgi:hypothetical protein
MGLLITSSTVHAGIPQSERDVLIAIYDSMNGDAWFYSTNWCAGTCPTSGTAVFNAAGTECTWQGVTCDDSEAHVVGLYLPGSTGTIPDLSGLTALQVFSAPASFGPNRNFQLTGAIPALASLKALRIFFVEDNQLTGSIPSLVGLSSLQYFDVSYNSLTGDIPNLSGLISLQTFNAGHNELSGSIPDLSGLGNGAGVDVSYNQLTGSIPPLQSTTLGSLVASHNRLAGPIPTLDGSSLTRLDVGHNQLTGSIPALAGSNLTWFDVGDNRLSGSLPTPPSSWTTCNQPYFVCRAVICPNSFDLVDSKAWDRALGVKPWWASPFPDNTCDETFNQGFELSPPPPPVI